MTRNARKSFNQSVPGFKFSGFETANSHMNKANQGTQRVNFRVTNSAGEVKMTSMPAQAVVKRFENIKDNSTVSAAQKAEFTKAIKACQGKGLLPKVEATAKAKVTMSA